MKIYAESSAVLAWLLGEPAGRQVMTVLEAAEETVASDLTLVECDRSLIRAATLGMLTEADAADRRAQLIEAAVRWDILAVTSQVVERARQPFPGEPIRTLDAIHLASALTARAATSGLELLTLDDRIRTAAGSLGLPLQPV